MSEVKKDKKKNKWLKVIIILGVIMLIVTVFGIGVIRRLDVEIPDMIVDYWSGIGYAPDVEHSIDDFNFSKKDRDYRAKKKYMSLKDCVSYEEYVEICNVLDVEQIYKDKGLNYIVISENANSCNGYTLWLIGVSYVSKTANVSIKSFSNTASYAMASMDRSGHGSLLVIPTDRNIKRVRLSKQGASFEDVPADKPIVYFYPEREIDINVKVKKPELLTCTYPLYDNNNGWDIKAYPNSDLIDLNTGRKLYSLYYEANSNGYFNMEKDGFIVEKENIIPFLEEKLSLLGLSEREANEFIIYWLPRLEKNEYNYIRFSTGREVEKYMPLEFSVKPDTEIRVIMVFKGLSEPIEVVEQKIETPKRVGFTVVEWGGVELY